MAAPKPPPPPTSVPLGTATPDDLRYIDDLFCRIGRNIEAMLKAGDTRRLLDLAQAMQQGPHQVPRGGKNQIH